MTQLLAPIAERVASALIQAIVTRLLVRLWSAYARNWHAHAAAAYAV